MRVCNNGTVKIRLSFMVSLGNSVELRKQKFKVQTMIIYVSGLMLATCIWLSVKCINFALWETGWERLITNNKTRHFCSLCPCYSTAFTVKIRRDSRDNWQHKICDAKVCNYKNLERDSMIYFIATQFAFLRRSTPQTKYYRNGEWIKEG